MISMVMLNGKEKEIPPFKNIIKELAAKMTEENWTMEYFALPNELKEYIDKQPLLDLCCYDITLQDSLESLPGFRKEYEEMGLLLITDAAISPILYLKPGIRADSLLMRPLNKEVVYATLEEFFSSYLEKMNRLQGVKSYIIESKEGRIHLPYKDIFYFEAREKKVFVRTLNEEYGFYTTMEQLENELPEQFIRCHRSFIVNSEKIKKVMLTQNLISLIQGFDVPLSRSYKPVLKQFGK